MEEEEEEEEEEEKEEEDVEGEAVRMKTLRARAPRNRGTERGEEEGDETQVQLGPRGKEEKRKRQITSGVPASTNCDDDDNE